MVTISRQFGSMGRSIACELSERLGIPFYDRDIVEETAKRMALPISVISDKEEISKSIYFKRKYPLGMGITSIQDEIFLVQKSIIRDMAAKESCIIVGRCADSILKDLENKLRVYIYAPYEARYTNCIEQLGMDEARRFYNSKLINMLEWRHFLRMVNLDEFAKVEDKDIRSSGYVIDSLEAAMWSLITTNTLEEGLLRAVNLGDDTDTVGAIAGGLAALYYGYNSIPENWRSAIIKRDESIKMCMRAQEEFYVR